MLYFNTNVGATLHRPALLLPYRQSSSLGVPRRMAQRHEHLALRHPLQPHVVLDDRVATREVVLVPQPQRLGRYGVPTVTEQNHTLRAALGTA